jgi:chromosome segregation ATPase
MTEEATNLVLEHLRRIREVQEAMQQDIHDVKLRMSATERHMGEIVLQIGTLNSRMDRVDERLGRIERRLELVEA